MYRQIHVFRQVLSRETVGLLVDDVPSLSFDDEPEGPFLNHDSTMVACSCFLCTPRVFRTCLESGEPVSPSISAALRTVHELLGNLPETHCINGLASGSRHLHHVDADEDWWKFIVVLSRADLGGTLSVARRCDPCSCLADGRCSPRPAIDLDLQPGDAYGLWSGRICHGVSTVEAGVRMTWALRYAGEPKKLRALTKAGRVEVVGMPPKSVAA
jgi:hypothetical protein